MSSVTQGRLDQQHVGLDHRSGGGAMREIHWHPDADEWQY
jgi:oxalate decarboxylase/phosphoglucose isomerase-like protein (cupin superfamily)